MDGDDNLIRDCFIIRAIGHPFELVAFDHHQAALDHIAELRKLVLYRRAQIQVVCVMYSPVGGVAVERVTTVSS